MTTRSRTILAALAAALVCTTLTGCGTGDPAKAEPAPRAELDPSLHEMLPAGVRSSGVLRVGTDASYAPMSSYAADGRTIVGTEPDLGKRLGEVLGVKVTFVNTDFTKILPEVAAGKLDLGMSAITDTTEREKQVDFVNYFSAGTAIVVQRGNPAGITELGDLCGKKVAVEDGTTQVDLLARAQGNCTKRIKVTSFGTNSDALVQLRTGRAAAVLNDLPPAVFLTSDRRTSSQYQLASTTQYEPGLYGIAVAKDRQGLRDAVQGALEKLVRSGAYQESLRHWGVDEGAVGHVTVNSGT